MKKETARSKVLSRKMQGKELGGETGEGKEREEMCHKCGMKHKKGDHKK